MRTREAGWRGWVGKRRFKRMLLCSPSERDSRSGANSATIKHSLNHSTRHFVILATRSKSTIQADTLLSFPLKTVELAISQGSCPVRMYLQSHRRSACAKLGHQQPSCLAQGKFDGRKANSLHRPFIPHVRRQLPPSCSLHPSHH